MTFIYMKVLIILMLFIEQAHGWPTCSLLVTGLPRAPYWWPWPKLHQGSYRANMVRPYAVVARTGATSFASLVSQNCEQNFWKKSYRYPISL